MNYPTDKEVAAAALALSTMSDAFPYPPDDHTRDVARGTLNAAANVTQNPCVPERQWMIEHIGTGEWPS